MIRLLILWWWVKKIMNMAVDLVHRRNGGTCAATHASRPANDATIYEAKVGRRRRCVCSARTRGNLRLCLAGWC